MGKIVGIIPARWASTRFPGKMLHPIAGTPLIQRVWERCQQARQLHRVIVATDEERIAETVRAFGGEAVMTSPDFQSGTDRIADAAARLDADVSHVINIQGDEPTISPALIDRLAAMLQDDNTLGMVTAASVMTDLGEITNPNCVKVVLAKNGDALYFSRSVIPHPFGCADARVLPPPPRDLRVRAANSSRGSCVGNPRPTNVPNAWNSCARSKTGRASGCS